MDLFIFEPGVWLGEGKVSFSTSQEIVFFRTKWTIYESGLLEQRIETVDASEPSMNSFFISDREDNTFKISMENASLEKVYGTGGIEDNRVFWEFPLQNDFQGFEIYARINPEEYSFHAEYKLGDLVHTEIHGKLWKKSV